MNEMALILQGGGALGAFEFGVVTKLVDLGWKPVAVTGVSIGAINAASVAGARGGDIAASMRAMWQAITLPQVPWLPASQQANLSLLGNPNFWRSRTDYINMPGWTSLCETAPMLATLERICDFAQIRDPGHMRIAVTATDLHTGGPATFSNFLAEAAHDKAANHKQKLADLTPQHIVASGSLPPGFPATCIDERHYWDGGLFSNTPIDALLNMLEPDEIEHLPIFVVDLFPTADQPAPANLMDVQTRATALQYQNRFWAQYGGNGGTKGFVAMLDALGRIVAKDGDDKLAASDAYQWLMRLRALRNLHVIESAPAASGGDHDFSPYGVEQRYQAGRAAVAQHFEQAGKKPAQIRAAA